MRFYTGNTSVIAVSTSTLARSTCVSSATMVRYSFTKTTALLLNRFSKLLQSIVKI